MRRGILLNHMERHPEALEAYNQALTFNPTDPESLINRGITLDTLGHLEESLLDFDAALAVDPLSLRWSLQSRHRPREDGGIR